MFLSTNILSGLNTSALALAALPVKDGQTMEVDADKLQRNTMSVAIFLILLGVFAWAKNGGNFGRRKFKSYSKR